MGRCGVAGHAFTLGIFWFPLRFDYELYGIFSTILSMQLLPGIIMIINVKNVNWLNIPSWLWTLDYEWIDNQQYASWNRMTRLRAPTFFARTDTRTSRTATAMYNGKLFLSYLTLFYIKWSLDVAASFFYLLWPLMFLLYVRDCAPCLPLLEHCNWLNPDM